MFKQLLVVALVVVAVMLFARFGGAARRGLRGNAGPAQDSRGDGKRSPSRPALAGYALLLAALIAGTGMFYLEWQSNNSVVTVEVVDGSTGHTTRYEVLRKHLNGREFRTIDGRHVSLGANERMVRVEE